ncbi:MAG: hypothetical protein KBI35_10815 [Ruminococcus sp.]|nr:hypothetical protein [Ruminococcus sp.]MBP8594893.1 hypothetical protein [Ruminococcus sp.]MBQ3855858.1 hypothetical protein [Ruminococcus sp.]MBQ8121962.1 hypothetical protein [Ruminococcus sp.]HBB18848.1 hypothetical protein [Ruminococcus sp.]
MNGRQRIIIFAQATDEAPISCYAYALPTEENCPLKDNGYMNGKDLGSWIVASFKANPKTYDYPRKFIMFGIVVGDAAAISHLAYIDPHGQQYQLCTVEEANVGSNEKTLMFEMEHVKKITKLEL